MVAVSATTPEVGITAADLPHIFDPFFTTRADGTVLGLSIVQ
jgi:two-component system sensor histidine kinase HydH